jgi:K+-sensing histidine kinase KdpD
METVNLNRIVSEYLLSPEMEKLRLHHPDARFETRLDEGLMNMEGSPVHLSKMIMNLVSNAVEAMSDGGTVVITTENCYLDRPVEGYEDVDEGEYIRLTVSDQGIGMSPEVRARIFEPFFTKKVMGRTGTGLGMAVVWATVKDHKGYIDIRTKQDEGTTFLVYFPITTKVMDRLKPKESLASYMGKGESILVVDDVADQREIASGILKKLGYSVQAVSSGEEAVGYLREHKADLLILDMIMKPGMDGLET